MSTDNIPEGFEPSEVSAAKDIVQDELDTAKQAGDLYDEADIVALADRIVNRLVTAGVTIPDGLTSPFQIPEQPRRDAAHYARVVAEALNAPGIKWELHRLNAQVGEVAVAALIEHDALKVEAGA